MPSLRKRIKSIEKFLNFDHSSKELLVWPKHLPRSLETETCPGTFSLSSASHSKVLESAWLSSRAKHSTEGLNVRHSPGVLFLDHKNRPDTPKSMWPSVGYKVLVRMACSKIVFGDVVRGHVAYIFQVAPHFHGGYVTLYRHQPQEQPS